MDQAISIPDPDAFSKPYFFLSFNDKSELLYISPSVEDVLGYSPADVIGHKITDFLDASSPLNADVKSCQKKGIRWIRTRDNLWVVKAKGQKNKVVRVQTYGQHDQRGQILANHGLAQDVTNIFFKEQELHRRLLELKGLGDLLTERETAVLKFVVTGKLNKWIARELDVTQRTVENVRARLMSKFQAETTAELAAKAKELQLLTEVIILFDKPHSGFELFCHSLSKKSSEKKS